MTKSLRGFDCVHPEDVPWEEIDGVEFQHERRLE